MNWNISEYTIIGFSHFGKLAWKAFGMFAVENTENIIPK